MNHRFLTRVVLPGTRPILLPLVLLGSVLALPAVAQEDGSAVVLPAQAQEECELPVAPPLIPYEATYEQLKEAKQNIAGFQDRLITYRECLQSYEDDPGLTDGNRIALSAAHNYSVDMEERVANQFNTAVRDYKERQAAEVE
jgi:hypothetical protein